MSVRNAYYRGPGAERPDQAFKGVPGTKGTGCQGLRIDLVPNVTLRIWNCHATWLYTFVFVEIQISFPLSLRSCLNNEWENLHSVHCIFNDDFDDADGDLDYSDRKRRYSKANFKFRGRECLSLSSLPPAPSPWFPFPPMRASERETVPQVVSSSSLSSKFFFFQRNWLFPSLSLTVWSIWLRAKTVFFSLSPSCAGGVKREKINFKRQRKE